MKTPKTKEWPRYCELLEKHRLCSNLWHKALVERDRLEKETNRWYQYSMDTQPDYYDDSGPDRADPGQQKFGMRVYEYGRERLSLTRSLVKLDADIKGLLKLVQRSAAKHLGQLAKLEQAQHLKRVAKELKQADRESGSCKECERKYTAPCGCPKRRTNRI